MKELEWAVTLLGTVLMLSLTIQPILAQTGTFESYTGTGSGTTFVGNATRITSGAASFNFVGTGSNDTFNLSGGNASTRFVATGFLDATFNIVTGNPINGSSTFSLVGGDNSTFNILQNNFNGSVSISIMGGSNCVINDTSTGPVNDTTFSIFVGGNSTIVLNANFAGRTIINAIDPTSSIIRVKNTSQFMDPVIVASLMREFMRYAPRPL